MAQLVARFVRNEEVGGSNPPGSTGTEGPEQSLGAFFVLCAHCRLGRAAPSGLPFGYPPLGALRQGLLDVEDEVASLSGAESSSAG